MICRPNQQLHAVVRARLFHVQLHDVVQRSDHTEHRQELGVGQRSREQEGRQEGRFRPRERQTIPDHGGLRRSVRRGVGHKTMGRQRTMDHHRSFSDSKVIIG